MAPRGDDPEEYSEGGPTASRGRCEPGGHERGKGAGEPVTARRAASALR